MNPYSLLYEGVENKDMYEADLVSSSEGVHPRAATQNLWISNLLKLYNVLKVFWIVVKYISEHLQF